MTALYYILLAVISNFPENPQRTRIRHTERKEKPPVSVPGNNPEEQQAGQSTGQYELLCGGKETVPGDFV